jgi:ribonucleoside-diphosphate reductase alpha chain
MQAVVDDADWDLKAVKDGSTIRTVKARELFRQISKAAWECADPGMQFDTTINKWHTAANTGRINGSNPCSEYMSLDNSACNLASLNLLTFLDTDGTFDVEGYKAAIEVVFTAQEILVGNSDYPTEKIGETTRRFRQLGLGYANLGALLMAQGMGYDSDAGRAWAAALTALMTGHAYSTSARTAARMGPFAGYVENREPTLKVLQQHRAAAADIDEELVPTELLSAAQESWDTAVELAEQYGVRNSQATVLAPTGCLVGGSLVPTERGLVRLRSLGDVDGETWQPLSIDVQTDEGPQAAAQFFINGLEQVVDVETSRGYRIQGTTKHRVKVIDPATGEWVWKPFADIREGDLVPLALDQLIGSAQEVPLPPLPDAHWTSEYSAVVPRTMTPQLAELIGYFMGDGSLHARGLRFCVTSGDVDVVDRLQQLSKELFGLAAPVTPKQGYDEVRIDSVRLVLWWEACGFAKRTPTEGHQGKGYQPHIPDAVLYANDRETYAAFLRGLFEADGTVTMGYPVWSSTSIDMSHDVQSLMLALGFPTTRKVDTIRTGWGKAPLAVLRLLNLSANQRWREEIGFISDRKNQSVRRSVATQSARHDHIPLSRELVDRLAPENDRLRRVLLMEVARGHVSRTIATELFDRTGDAELGHLLSFFYDKVASAELGEEELTYDISVPSNVTYVANGFISHNTIGLLMDCDTTGVEPDLGLVKMKKLVGGGTMSIVNQTVPRALRRLGYSDSQVEAIVAYIDEHKTIVGAPELAAEHMSVFACSMGDNVIHYLGHVRMMSAVQPFISGAISKTCNVPEETTVDEIEQLHIDAWQMGLKAVAIYRDNCKVAQPLSTVKKDKPASAAEAHDAELAEKVAELEQALERQTILVKQPIRERLPRHRPSRTFSFRVADCEGYVTVGEYEDGRPGELFLKVSKQGSTLAGIMDAFAMAVSFGLQHGVPLSLYVKKYTNMRFEPSGMTDDPELRIASSLVDYIFRRMAVQYLPKGDRLELGIATTEERMQPTLPGVEEAVTESAGVVAPVPAPPVEPVTPPTQPYGLAHSDAPFCMQCGVQMQRAGSCHACPSCGTTSGCS